MPELSNFLSSEAVLTGLSVSNKKQALEHLSAFAAERTGLASDVIYDMLLQRERLGSTGVGEGFALPHSKIKGLEKLFGAAILLEKPVDYEALDGEPVDVFFLLLAPEDSGADHLKALARIARLFRKPGFLNRIRSARDPAALYILLTEGEAGL